CIVCSSHFVIVSTEQHINIKFCVLLHKTTEETLTLLEEGYVEEAMKKIQVYALHKRFSGGHSSIKDNKLIIVYKLHSPGVLRSPKKLVVSYKFQNHLILGEKWHIVWTSAELQEVLPLRYTELDVKLGKFLLILIQILS
ncbi:hypothetical protein C0J52_15739, partial [Blattella germanica]